MNEQFINDVKKAVQQTPLNQELPPGTPRRYEPVSGIKAHNNKIHKESKIADNKNLPFTFSKPRKSGRSITFKCDNMDSIRNLTRFLIPEYIWRISKF
jgi:hypothetical protein